jgi:hypothetical protein
MSGAEEHRAEHALLVAGARVALGTADATHLEDVLDRDIDWTFCTNEAVRHGVVSFLCDAFDHADTAETGSVPADERERLDEYRRHTVQRNLHLTGERVRLVDRFDDAGVDVLPFKGPVMAVKAYGDLTARTFADLDLLVRPDAFREAKQVVREAGYQEETAQTPTHAKIKQQYGRVAVFTDAEVTIELHRRLLSHKLGRGIRVNRLFERATSVDVAGTTVPTAPPAETLVMAAVHGTKHRWSRLEWLCGVAGLLDHADIDWDCMVTEADAIGKTRMVALTLSLAHDVLGVSLPQQGRSIIADDRQARNLHEQLTDSFLDEPNPAMPQKLLFQARTLDEVSDQSRFVLWFLFGPRPADVDFLRLPPWLTRGYHVIKPFRLALAAGELWAERLTR